MSLDPADPGRLVEANPAMADILGTSVEDLVGAPIRSLTHPEDHASFSAKLDELVRSENSQVGLEARFVHRDGQIVWALVSAALLPPGSPDSNGEARLAVTHVVDISERKQFEGQLQRLADYDALTGLYNRRRFTEELERELKLAERYGDTGAVLFLDLDGFKFVNDSLGHGAGDELITRVGSVLANCLRETDTLARAGGDEFAVLLPRCDETGAKAVAGKLLLAVRQQARVSGDGGHAQISTSIGIAPFGTGESLSADDLLVRADIAMYEAKEAGRDRCAVYANTDEQRERMTVVANWSERLRSALETDRFQLHAQPIVPIGLSHPPAFELLLRLEGDDDELIPPGTFLYEAERFGLIQQIDHWVLRQAVVHLSESHAAGEDLLLTVNVSGKTMGDHTLGAYVAGLIADHPIEAERLVIEITETAAITNMDRARVLAAELRALGCRLALDDFGAGFASFYYLKHLDFDYLKVDGEFIRNLPNTPVDQLVVKAVVDIARGTGTRTVAEFVGDDETLRLVGELGVDFAQGYHLGRPAPLEERLPHLIARGQESAPTRSAQLL